VSTRPLPQLGSPQGEAAKELAALVQRGDELRDRVGAVDQEERAAHDELRRVGAALADLERRAASGEEIADKTREAAEKELARARATAASPWAERRAGVQAAARDQEHAIDLFIAQHFDELRVEVEEDGEAAAKAFDRGCRDIEAAYLERARVEQALTSLVARIRPTRPGDIAHSRAEGVRREVAALLLAGGEQPPKLRVDPRQPRHGEAIAEAEQPAA
jgi:chromosome segregation ATPase